MPTLTLSALTKEIERVSGEFRRLNARRRTKRSHYEVRSHEVEARICEHAETLARLRQFKSWLWVKEMLATQE